MALFIRQQQQKLLFYFY